jgi:anti-sigma B factor antagonist
MLVPDVRYLRKMISGVPVVGAPAEIDVTNAGQLRIGLLEAAMRGHAAVVVDMTRTVFCEASGIHVLVRAHQRAVAEGGGLCVAVPADDAVPRIIGLTCLDHLIPCFPAMAQAVARASAAVQAGAPAGVPCQGPEPRPGGGQVVTAC